MVLKVQHFCLLLFVVLTGGKRHHHKEEQEQQQQQLNNNAIIPENGAGGSWREAILRCHNEKRSELARGLTKNKDGASLPPGTNIYALEYSDALEREAQAHANRCVYEHAEDDGREYGQNTFKWRRSRPTTDVDFVLEGCRKFWTEPERVGLPSVVFKKAGTKWMSGVGHFTQMAWGKTTQLGCGVAHCDKFTLLVCNYSPRGNFKGEAIYDSGSRSCAGNADCTAYSPSQCDQSTGLCHRLHAEEQKARKKL